MLQDWTIDTDVLYRLAAADIDATLFLMAILRQRHIVMLDMERHIEGEYRRCLKKTEGQGGNELLKKWFGEIVSKSAQYCSGKLSKRQRTALEALKFDRDDWPFVGVCRQTESKRLVAEESDYTKEVRAYLEQELMILVLSVNDSLNLIE